MGARSVIGRIATVHKPISYRTNLTTGGGRYTPLNVRT
jgi:hypothetical protein